MITKRDLIVIIIIVIVFFFYLKYHFTDTTVMQSIEESQDILYQDVIITALSPTINKAIVDYYKDILTVSPVYGSRSIKILDIERPNGNRTSHFIIRLEVEPFVGPHITVGKDLISISLSYPGTQEVLEFEHIKDYPLPTHYQEIYIH